MIDARERAAVLVEALPYIRMFAGKTVVIKYGGAAMLDEGLKRAFAQDVVLLRYVGVNPIVVHGGGPQITETLRRLGVASRFVEGMRVTDADTMAVVEMVLTGQTNPEIVRLINAEGGQAVGLSGKDGGLLTARKLEMVANGETIDLGLVGEVERVDPRVLAALEREGFIPVIAPIGVGRDGTAYNINADLAAGAIAASLKAVRLILLTDQEGVLGRDGRLLPTLGRQEARRLVAEGVISGGMIPKVECCLSALVAGVEKATIADGRVPHALLLELFTDQGVGTQIV
ncbi:MAG TPA: acetylglutamate kinase [Thermodesulfobacteriota bacterium]|nr:acetylglutamate kinase [Thermodesulfobacteriota bacterium]